MERPEFFSGVVLSGPAVELDPKTDTKCFVSIQKFLEQVKDIMPG